MDLYEFSVSELSDIFIPIKIAFLAHISDLIYTKKQKSNFKFKF